MNLIISAISMYQLVLAAYAVMTWFPQAQRTALFAGLARLCEPYLSLFSRFIPQVGNVSLDVVVGILLLNVVKRILG